MTTAFDSTGFDATAFDSEGVIYPSGTIALGLSVHIAEPFSIVLPASVFVVDKSYLDGTVAASYQADKAAVWGVSVLISGVEMADSIVGEIVVEAEENAARFAEFSVSPAPGAIIYIDQWVGRPVEIYFTDQRPGYAANNVLLFSGRVELPRLDFEQRLIALQCSDSRLSMITGMTLAEVEEFAAGSYYSSAVFNDAAGPQTQLNDRLSTIPCSVECTPTGNLRLSSLLASEIPDFTFGVDTVIDGSIGVDFAEKSQMINQVEIEFQYRFPRVKAEGYSVSANWLGQTGFADYINDGKLIPARAQVVSAINAAGGTVVSITYDALPTVPINVNGGVWMVNPFVDPYLCTGFSAVVSFDYAQDIEEQFRIIVRNAASIERIGVVKSSMTGALEGKSIDTASSIETGIQLYKSDLIAVSPVTAAPVTAGMTTSADVALSEDTDRAAAENAMATLIAIAKKQIIEAHRLNRVSFSIPLHPTLDTDKTVGIDLPKLQAQGKCRLLRHRIDSASGLAISEVELAISAIAGMGFVHPSDPVVPPSGTTASTTVLSMEPTVVFNNVPPADGKITITFPGVDEIERAKATHHIASTVEVAIPENLLAISL